MHPILAERGRLVPYLAAWVLAGGLLAALLALTLPWPDALLLGLPLTLPYGFACLSAWYVCRSLPLRETAPLRLTLTQLAAAGLSTSLWLGLARVWGAGLEAAGLLKGAEAALAAQAPLLFAVGVLLFLLASALHYVLIAFEESRDAERRALTLKVASAEAELRALRAQLDPHFLFNSLNSISALTTADPQAARRMCLLLSDFLRGSLTLGARDRISLDEELSLVGRFVEVERVRFGARLGFECEVEEAVRNVRLPPLLLQPLVENAVIHGIAHRLEGGTVRIEARRRGERVVVSIANPCDPERPAGRGTGLGLQNVRRRLEATWGREARLDVTAAAESYRVELSLPV